MTVPNMGQMSEDNVSLRGKKCQKSGHIMVTMTDQLEQVHPLLISGHHQTQQEEYDPDSLLLDSHSSCGLFSYLPQDQVVREGKAPVYLSWEQVSQKREYPRVQEGNSITKNGELKCTDKEVLKKQSGVIMDILKKVTQSIVEGRGIVGVSLPVRIFQPISTIERIVDWWTYCPRYLPKAA